jgi:PAS domain S-box-containing protein
MLETPFVESGIHFLNSDNDFFDQIRNKDWGKTSLGSMLFWPQSLRTAVSLCLNSPYPALLLWGKDMTMIYNEGYAQILKEKHPVALGSSAKQILKETWRMMGVTLDHVLKEGKAFYLQNQQILMNRNGYLEECYFNFSYSPVYDETGGVGGIFVPVTETTDEIIGKRHSSLLRHLSKYLKRTDAIDEIYERAVNAFETNPYDFPVAFIYSIENGGKIARRKAITGIKKDHAAVRPVIDLSFEEGHYLAKAISTKKPVIIDKVSANFPGQPFDAWAGSADQAILLPVVNKGETYPFAVLTVVCNPFKRLSDTSVDFYQAVADVIATEIFNVKVRESKRQHEIQLEHLFAQAPVALSIFTGPHYVIEIANRRMLELWGKTGDAVIGKPVFEALPELKADTLEKILNTVSSTGLPYTVHESEVQLQRKGMSTTVYVNFVYKPLRTDAGTVSGIIAIAVDVTDQLLARKKAEDSELRFRRLIDALPVGFYTVDDTGTVETFNDAAVALWQNQPEVGKDKWGGADKIFSPEGAELSFEQYPIFTALKDRCSVNREIVVRRADGSRRHVLSYPQATFDSGGKLTGAMNVLVDITERKESEVALQKSEAKFRWLGSAIPELIWISDADGNLNYFNDSVFRFSGLTYDEIVNNGWLQIIHPDDRDENMMRWNHSIKTGEDFVFEHRLVRRDSEFRWHLSRAVPQRDGDGRIHLWIGLSTDIHDQKIQSEALEKQVEKRTEELRIANEKLSRTNTELEQFAYVSSHDLQEPLRKIHTFAQMASSLVESNPEAKQYLEKIKASAHRMSGLITDLLNLSRLSKPEDAFGAVDLNEVFDAIKSDFELVIAQKNVSIQLLNKLPVVIGIQSQVTQLFSNLISNSIKFCKKDPCIEISSSIVRQPMFEDPLPVRRERYYAKIILKDNGIGFDQKYADKIFTIFQRLNNRRDYSGSGIGLAICKKIVENHQGRITVRSAVNDGTSFTIFLPVGV